MTYTPFLISNFSTGFDRERQPWLLPNDAQDELLDGYVYRGVWQNRDGYTQYATGEKGGAPYCESRMVHRITAENIGTGNGVQLIFNAVLADIPVRRGTVTVNYTIAATPRTATDNGLGVLTGFGLNSATTTLDYTSGAIHLVFTTAPDNATAITVTYDAHQGFPVMGIMNFFTQSNTREMIVADTTYVNRFNIGTNRLEDISPAVLLTGTNKNFFTWTNYPGPDGLQRLLFVNNKDPVQQYSGTTVTPFEIYASSAIVTGENKGVGDGTPGPYALTSTNAPIIRTTLVITAGAQVVTDDGFGNLQGDGTGTVDYATGDVSVTFNANVSNVTDILFDYHYQTDAILTALHIFNYKDRLVVLAPTLADGSYRGLRIMISGTGIFGDTFTTEAIGAGFIDIPDNTFIQSSDFNRDQLIIFTSGTWSMNYTGNDIVPFTLNRLDESRGSGAPYGTKSYLNRTNSPSPRGLIITDGYSVERTDEKIPDFSYNEIDQDNFDLCFAGFVDEDRDHYLIYPQPNQTESSRILVTNYEEDNYSIYRLPLSCMGNYIQTYDVTWNDLLIYKNWDELANDYGNWNEFAYDKGAPFAMGGGHHGQITRLNTVESEDYPVKIRGITITDEETLQVTTDFNEYQVGDYIDFDGVLGMLEVNNKQGFIPEEGIISNYVFNVRINTTGFNAYTSDGVASKVIVFDSTTKKFNPFTEMDQKVRCGWVYLYVSTTGTELTVNQYILGATQSNPCVINIPGHGYQTGQQVFIDGVGGMVELNNEYYYITVIDEDNFSLDGIDSTGFTTYTSGGFSSIPEDAILQMYVSVNDVNSPTQVNPYNPTPYYINLTSKQDENGVKKWYKLWINQTGRFIQFQFVNNQAGAKVQIQAIMPGFAGVGRLI